MKKASLYKELAGGNVRCGLCSHFCVIESGERGKCGVRQNIDGVLYSLSYNRVAAMSMDPVEKKPLYHFLPGTQTFSLGTMGCNMGCRFCQNWSLSQPPRQGRDVSGQQASPEQLVRAAMDNRAQSIAYTYSEPTIFFELMLETALLAKERGLKNIIVSNGFQSPECLDRLGPVIDAANIDLKSFSNAFYMDTCGARLDPVLKNLKHMKDMGWLVETTTLVIPGLNDSPAELGQIAEFIATDLGVDTPWHISRFHPQYKMGNLPPTPLETLALARDLGEKAGLNYVYLGNVPGGKGGDTICPSCKKTVIGRTGFYLEKLAVADGKCSFCGQSIHGIWE